MTYPKFASITNTIGEIHDICEQAKLALKKTDLVILKGFSSGINNENLLALARSLGEITLNGTILDNKPLEQDLVYTVQVHTQGIYDNELLIYSTTNKYFPYHTDDSCTELPADLVILLCELPSNQGGESFVAHVDEVVQQLNELDILFLREPIYCFQFGLAPILTYKNDSYSIRYNRIEIDRFSKSKDIFYSDRVYSVMEKLDNVLKSLESSNSFVLKKDECMVINNHKVLHGRGSFPIDSNRKLKRLRLYSELTD